jgi:serine/threonine protein kinase
LTLEKSLSRETCLDSELRNKEPVREPVFFVDRLPIPAIRIFLINFFKKRVAKVDLKTENPNVQAFKQELHHFKKTRHDNVELFLGACLTPPNLAILTRYYQGPRLDKKIKEESLSLGSVFERESHLIKIEDNARLLADHIINGLKYLHAKDILHKDLRPANIMYDLVGKVKMKNVKKQMSIVICKLSN